MRPLSIATKLPRSTRAAALAVSLVFSALLTAVALRSPDYHWLAWISFLPLFVVVRWLRPATAALAGGLWGASLYAFFTTNPTPTAEVMAPTIGPWAWLLALMIVIPAVYVGLAARPARAIGFKLLTLALGWTLVTAVLHYYNPSGTSEGLLAGSQGEGPHLHWMARMLGYVCVAFLVACANASLVGMLCSARLRFPACRSLTGLPNSGAGPPSQIVLPIQSWTLRQAHPRAPPIQVLLR